MLKEFKKFAFKGNMIDMAVGIIIGAAFGTVVTSLVKDVIMPPIGALTGGIDFGSLFWDLSGKGYATLEAAQAAGAATINYGAFLNNLISFLIVAFAVFLLVKGVNKAMEKEKEEEKPASLSKEETLLTEIRDLLKEKKV